MSHTPERVDQYVCRDCQVIHAGTVVRDEDGEHTYEAPGECGACGGTTLVELSQYPRAV